MNPCLVKIMRDHGLHKHISADCQNRMEFLFEHVVRECANRLDELGNPELGKGIRKHFGVKE